MPRTLDLASLEPQVDTVRWEGVEYPMKSSLALAPAELAEMARLSEAIQGGMEALRKTRDLEAVVKTEALIKQRFVKLLHVVVPDLPVAVLEGLDRYRLNGLMEYWSECDKKQKDLRDDAVTSAADPGEQLTD